MRRLKKFTREQVKSLALNPYTSSVDFRHIWYTEEFMKLFLERYKNGDTSFEIFSSCGYDIDVLGENRIYGFPRRVTRLMGISQGLSESTEKTGASKPQTTGYDAMSTQQTISDMQRELEYLRRQVQMLKNNTGTEGVEGSNLSDT